MTRPLETRYPQLDFMLRFVPYKKSRLKKQRTRLPDLTEIEVVYVVGLGNYPLLSALMEWVEGDEERDLVLLEEELGQLASFLELKESDAWIAHPQVHIKLLMDVKEKEAYYKELAAEFPFQKIEVIGDESVRLELMRKTTVAHALFAEDLYYHRLYQNLRPNFSKWVGSLDGEKLQGAFANIPAVICGAGPSLQRDFATLKTLQDKALLFAGGSAATALTKAGIEPHFAFALDPNPQEWERLKEARLFETPLFYGTRLLPKVLEYFHGPRIYLRTHTGGLIEAHMEKILGISAAQPEIDFDQEALSITTTCLSQAVRMGCNPIILVGVDLAFTNDQSYVSGVVADSRIALEQLKKDPRAAERLIETTGRDGKPLFTLVKWVMEQSTISAFAKKHPEIQWINGTHGGLGFADMPYRALSDVPLPPLGDLKGLVHARLSPCTLPVTEQGVDEALDSLDESLQRLLTIAQDILEAPQKALYLESDFEEELAFTTLLFPVEHALSRILKRRYRNNKEKRIAAKWNYLKTVIEQLLLVV